MLSISAPTARATTADVTATVLSTVASRPPMRACAVCRTMMERATEMANDVSQAAAYSKENERVNPPPVSQHKTIAFSSRAALIAFRPHRVPPCSRIARTSS